MTKHHSGIGLRIGREVALYTFAAVLILSVSSWTALHLESHRRRAQALQGNLLAARLLAAKQATDLASEARGWAQQVPPRPPSSVSLWAYLSASGDLLSARYRSPAATSDPAPPTSPELKSGLHQLAISARRTQVPASSLILTSDGPLLLSAVTLQKGAGTSPPRAAVLVVGQPLDTDWIGQVLSRRVLALGDAEAPPTDGGRTHGATHTWAGSIALPASNGLPPVRLWLASVDPEGVAARHYLPSLLLVLIALVGLGAGAHAQRQAVNRLRRLAREMAACRADGSDTCRVSLDGRDEITALESELNHTLEVLVESRGRLQVSETQLRDLVETTSDWIWQVDAQAAYTYVSPKLRDTLGYDPQEVLGKTPFDLMAPEEAARVAEVFGGIATRREAFARLQNTCLHADGHPVAVETSGVPIFDEAGEFCGYRGADRDVTQQHRAEKTVQAQRDLATSLLKATSVEQVYDHLLDVACALPGVDCGGVYKVDDQTGMVELTSTHNLHPRFAAQACSYPPDSPQARSLQAGQAIHVRPPEWTWSENEEENVYPRDLAAIPIAYEGRTVASLNLGAYSSEGIPVTSRQAIEAVAAQAGAVIGRIRAERELQDSHENLEALFANISDIITIGDENGRVVEINPAATRILGYPRDELLTMQIDHMHPAERRAEAGQIVMAMLEGRTAVCILPLLAKDGTHIPAETVVTRGHWNKRPAIYGISRDLSDRERAKHALAESSLNRALAEALQRLSRSLVVAQEDERRRIALELHDEVGQNLTGLLLLLENRVKLAPERFLERVAKAREVAIQLLGTVRQMSMNLRPPHLDDLGLCQALTFHFTRYTDQTGIAVDHDFTGEDHGLSAELNITVYRIIQEALTNVARHAGVRLVSVSLQIDDNTVTMAVADQGQGFDLDKPVVSMGLASLKERASALGGRVEIQSQPGAGTTVKTVIPRPTVSTEEISDDQGSAG